MTELLAPAGNMAALKAALANGADAVYVAGQQFSAGAPAENFSEQELSEALIFTHFMGKKLYLAVNSLLTDEELQQALEFIARFYCQGLDGVIAQDLALLSLLRSAMPDLPLQASAQISVTNASTARFLAAQGARRLYLARELSLKELKTLRGLSKVELGAYVHGSLCCCYPGHCLFSSMTSGHSANRGHCDQPCRQAYTITDRHGDPLPLKAPGPYLLSLSDLAGYWLMEELHACRLDAWEIEGLNKKPEYVATACRVYSEHLHLLDQRRVIYQEEEELRQLLQMFNRDHGYGYWQGEQGGSLISYKKPGHQGVFLGRVLRRADSGLVIKLEQPLALEDGLEIFTGLEKPAALTVQTIYHGGNSVAQAAPGDVVSIPSASGKAGDSVYKLYDEQLHLLARRSYENMPKKPLHFTIQARLGAPLKMSARDEDGFMAEALSSYIIEAALTTTCDWQTVQAQLTRADDSGYTFASLDGELAEGIMLPASALNASRNELVAALLQQRRLAGRQAELALPQVWPRQREELRQKSRLQLSALIDQPEMLPRLLAQGLTDIYFGTEGWRPGPGPDELDWLAMLEQTTKAGGNLAPSLPAIISLAEEKAWIKRITAWQKAGFSALRLNHCGQLELARAAGWLGQLSGGAGCNIYNSESYLLLSRLGAKRLTLSPELSLDELTALDDGGADKELLALGAISLMISEHCVLGALSGGPAKKACSAPCGNTAGYALRDDKGFLFPVKCDASCRMHIFHHRQLCLLEEIPALAEAGLNRLVLDLRLFPPEQALRLASLFQLAVGDEWQHLEAVEKLPQILREYSSGQLRRRI